MPVLFYAHFELEPVEMWMIYISVAMQYECIGAHTLKWRRDYYYSISFYYHYVMLNIDSNFGI